MQVKSYQNNLSYYYKVRVFIYIILMPFTMFMLAGCADDVDCNKTCENGGVLKPTACECQCPSGYIGEFCETLINVHKLHADISIDGAPSYSYDPPKIITDTFDHILTDTLWIDGYSDVPDSYCFMRLYLNDLSTITPGATYDIQSDNALGTAWAAFKDPAIDPNPYFPKTTSTGKLKITDYRPGTKIAGTFDFKAYNGTSEAHIVGWFEGNSN